VPVQVQVPLLVLARPRPRPVLLSRGRHVSGLGAVAQVLDPKTTATIAGVIQQQEGYYPGSLAYQNNNPGNLIYAGQPGATQGAGGFAAFPDYQAGLDALNNQIQLYAARGLSIQQMMNIYAPATQAGNNPALYASRIAAALGVSPDTPLLDPGMSSPVLDQSTVDVPTHVYTDTGVFPLQSFLPASVDPVTLGIGAAALGLVLYATLGN
jgi:hypothetical protein